MDTSTGSVSDLKISKDPSASCNQDSGYISQSSCLLSSSTTSSDLLMSTSGCSGGSAPGTSSSSSHHQSHPTHMKTCSISSSGYYSRLDSNDDHLEDLLEEKEEKVQLLPWQSYFQQDPDCGGNCVLHMAVFSKDEALLESILSIIPHPSVLNVQNDKGQTALHLSILTNQPRVTRLLIIAGGNSTIRDFEGNKCIHLATSYGFKECVEAVTMAVSMQELSSAQNKLCYQLVAPLGCDLDSTNYDGQTPLHIATLHGHHEIIQTLCWTGADTGKQDGKGGRTALHYAVEACDFQSLQMLLKYSKKSTLDKPNYSGLTPYQLSSCNKLREFCDVLLTSGCDDEDYFSSDSEDDDDDSLIGEDGLGEE